MSLMNSNPFSRVIDVMSGEGLVTHTMSLGRPHLFSEVEILVITLRVENLVITDHSENLVITQRSRPQWKRLRQPL